MAFLITREEQNSGFCHDPTAAQIEQAEQLAARAAALVRPDPNPRYHVIYDAPYGVRAYCREAMDWKTAQAILAEFTEKYVGKPYPSGRGFYPFTNPRIVKAR